MALPRRLGARAATWTREVDIVIVGGGAAGLAVALAARPSRSVVILTKDGPAEPGGPTRSVADGDLDVMHLTCALDLVMVTGSDGRRRAVGVRVGRTDPHGGVESVGTIVARAVVIASGGYGQVFASTSAPPASTGDGIAMALRAGVPVHDVEFVRFHPTILWRGPEVRGVQTIVPESIRRAGAVLVDAAGERIMRGVHPREDLAPRDVVSVAIASRMAEAPGGVDDHVFLDATGSRVDVAERCATVDAACREIGLDPAVDPIPVAPAAHSGGGGIVVDPDGATGLTGLFAVGDAASTGLLGANPLVSDSTTEASGVTGVTAAIIAGRRLGRLLAVELPDVTLGAADLDDRFVPIPDRVLLDPLRLREVRAVMSRHVGVTRSESGLAMAVGALGSLARSASVEVAAGRESWEATNLLTVASATASAALARTESRGCHRRSDHPESDRTWEHHLRIALDGAGAIDVVPLG